MTGAEIIDVIDNVAGWILVFVIVFLCVEGLNMTPEMLVLLFVVFIASFVLGMFCGTTLGREIKSREVEDLVDKGQALPTCAGYVQIVSSERYRELTAAESQAKRYKARHGHQA